MIKDFFKQIFSFRLNDFMFFAPFVKSQITSIGDYKGINYGVKRDVPIIVSLYSGADNFNDLPHTIYSLLNQAIKPDRLILWVDETFGDLNNLSYDITQFIKNGLEIRFVKDLKSYTNKYYPIKEFPNAINISAENGYFYKSNWLKLLYLSYVSNNSDIQVHNALKVSIKNNDLMPYKTWTKTNVEKANYTNFTKAIGGILFPPNCFGNEFLRKDIFLRYAPNNDDLWIWIMALIHSKKIRLVKSHIHTFPSTSLKKILQPQEIDNTQINEQLEEILKFYQQNVYKNLF